MEAEGCLFHYIYTSLLFEIDSRVDYLVDNVTDKVHNYNECGEHDCCAHNKRVVTVGDTADKLTSNSGNGEDLLNDQRTGDDIGKHRTKVSDNGNKRILQSVIVYKLLILKK